MRKLLIALVVLVPFTAGAQTQFVFTDPKTGAPASTGASISLSQMKAQGATKQDLNGDVSGQHVTPVGASASAALNRLLVDRITVRSFGAACDGVTDDSAAVAAGTLALQGTGAALRIPNDCRILMGGTSQAILDGVSIEGDTGRDSGNNAGAYGTRGGTVLMTDTTKPPFIVKRNWGIKGLILFWPAQVEDSSAPRTFPPFMTGSGSAEVSAGRFENNDILNAYVIGDFSAGFGGGYHIHNNRGYCLSACWRLRSMPLESFVSGNDWTPNPYQNVALSTATGATHNLRDYAAQHASVFEIVGDGTPSVASTTSVDGLNWSGDYVFGLYRGMRLLGGTVNLLSMAGNGLDGVARVVSVETGGRVAMGNITGGQWYPYTFGFAGGAESPIYAASDSSPGSNLTVTGIAVPSAVSSLANWNAPTSALSLFNIRAPSLNALAGGTAPGVTMNSSGGQLTMVGDLLTMQGSAPGACVQVSQPLQLLVLVGNQFVLCQAPVTVDGSSAPTGSVLAGNVSIATRGTAAITGAQALSLSDVGNSWDKPAPGWSTTRRALDGALVFSVGGAAQASISTAGALRAAGAITPSVTP